MLPDSSKQLLTKFELSSLLSHVKSYWRLFISSQSILFDDHKTKNKVNKRKESVKNYDHLYPERTWYSKQIKPYFFLHHNGFDHIYQITFWLSHIKY